MNPSDPGEGAVRPEAFCQQCGRPLDRETIRRVGSAVYCEPCLAARLGETPAGASDPNWVPPGVPPVPPIPPGVADPNPGLAALLGFIPGVGAVYNGQYVKGVIHLIVFVLLLSLCDNVSGMFGIFVAGWIFYMAIEAHHTARARRDGTPLPNPFGLNDLNDRLGFGRTWQQPPYTPPYVPPAQAQPPYTPPADPHEYARQYAEYLTQQTIRDAQARAPWGVPYDAHTQAGAQGTYPPAGAYQPPMSTMPPFVPVRNRFPGGAVWLIALGVIFLVGNTGLFRFRPTILVGFFMIGFGTFLFVRRMTRTGQGLADDGTPFYRARLIRCLRGSVWIIVTGILMLLNDFNILRWHRSWPLYLIVLGILTLLERTAFTPPPGPFVPPYGAPPTPPTYPGPATAPAPHNGSSAQGSASIVPFTRSGEEGK